MSSQNPEDTQDNVRQEEPAADAKADGAATTEPSEAAASAGEPAESVAQAAVAEAPEAVAGASVDEPVEPAAAAEAAAAAPPPAAEASAAPPAEEAAAGPAPHSPAIEAIEPDHGPLGGISFTIRGQHFVDGCSVIVGQHEAPSVTFRSATELLVQAPAVTKEGYADVTVTNRDRQSALRPHGFAYDPPPDLTEVKPDVASTAGGTTVALIGQGFVEGCTVSIAGQAVEPITFVDSTCLKAVAPAQPAGQVAIRVENPDGQSGTATEALRYEPGPAITKIEPAEGPITGGTELTITGEGFDPECSVTFLDKVLAVTFDSAEQIRVVTPAHEAEEAAPLRITNPNGLTCRQADAYRYHAPRAPRIAAVSPAEGYCTGGKRVTISGSDFAPGCTVRFGEATAAKVSCLSSGVLEVTVPASELEGPVDLVVVNPDEQSATLPAGFRYEAPPAPPKIISISPNKGYCAGNLKVVITGDNFNDKTVIRIGEVQARTKLLSPTSLEVYTPAYAGAGPVAVEASEGEIAVRIEGGFTYEERPAPEIAGIDPQQGPCTGGTKVTIEGKNLFNDGVVRFGRETAKILRVKGTELMVVETPPQRAAGLVDVALVTGDGKQGVLPKIFRYKEHPAPKIESVVPACGGVAGGTELSIEGQSFVTGSEVFMGGQQVQPVKLVRPGVLELKTPAGKHGQMVDVEVRNPDGKKAVARRAFKYDERYG